MTEDGVRQRIQAGFRNGAIPRMFPSGQAPDVSSSVNIIVGGGSGHPCSACGEPIGPHDPESIAFRYPMDRFVRFHGRCGALWAEERFTD